MNKMTSSASEVLDALQRLGVSVTVRDGTVFLCPGSKIPVCVIERAKACKPELIRLLTEGPKPIHPEHREMMDLITSMRDARRKLVQSLTEEGRRLGWPRVKLAPWMHLVEGEESWQTFLNHPAHGVEDLQGLFIAIQERTEEPKN